MVLPAKVAAQSPVTLKTRPSVKLLACMTGWSDSVSQPASWDDNTGLIARLCQVVCEQYAQKRELS